MVDVKITLVIVVLIAVIYYMSTPRGMCELDRTICSGWWYGSSDFCDQAGLDYMFVQIVMGDDNQVVMYVIAGDVEGLTYNMPLRVRLTPKSGREELKAKYDAAVAKASADDDGDMPFPEKSVVVVDRAANELSIYQGETLYAHLQKNTS